LGISWLTRYYLPSPPWKISGMTWNGRAQVSVER
jgi:hypothetical protein